MPSLQEIQQFQEILNELGDEPAILAERGEAIEEVPAPDEGLPGEGLTDLVETEPGEPGEAAGVALEAFDLELEPMAEAPAEPISAEPVLAEAGGAQELELDDLLGIASGEEPETAGAGEGPPPGEVDEFTIPEGLFDADLFETAAEGPAEEEGPEELPAEQAPAEGWAPEELPPEQAPETPAEQAGETAGLGEFELPEEFDLSEEDLGFPVSPEGEEAAAPAEQAAAEPSPEEAEFLRALEQDIFPAESPAVGPPGPAPETPPAAAAEQEPAAFEEQLFEEQPAEEPAPEAIELPEEGFSLEQLEPEGEHVDLEAAHVDAGGQPAVDEFDLEDFSKAFEVAEEPLAAPPEGPAGPPPTAPAAPAGPTAPPSAAAALQLSDRQFEALKRCLAALPRNLRIVIEELIAEKGLAGGELRALVDLLVRGAAPAAIAERTSRISGRRIQLPRSYARLGGLAFEEKQRTFGYAFRQNIWPILRVALVGLLFAGLVGFLGYRYVYRPLRANHLYRQGYSQIQKERYGLANERFDRATAVWVLQRWYFRYASAFADKRQYQLAGQKYEQLLKLYEDEDRYQPQRLYPGERRGVLAYAGLLTNHLAGYEQAELLLQRLLEVDIKDYQALLAQGDNYLQWAQDEEQAAAQRLERARLSYASTIDYYGERDEVMLRMMRYFIRADRVKAQDKLQETRELQEYLDGRRRLDVAPELLASVYAELGGYWIDRTQLDRVQQVLMRAMEARPQMPEVHYELARYYRVVGEAGEEVMALDEAIKLLKRTEPLDKRGLFLLIDALTRRGEAYYRRQEYLQAEQTFSEAIARIEQAQGRRVFRKGFVPEFGRAYKGLGDLYYYVSRDLTGALDMYGKAAANGEESSDLHYKIGHVHYAEGRFEEALLEFSRVVDRQPANENALFALANALYQGGYYSSAQGYYLRLLEILEARKDRIRFLQVYEDPEHRALVERLLKVYNNLGVTLRRLGERSRDPDKESKALVHLTFSSEHYDLISRDPQTAARGLTQNLAYLNQRGILYPLGGFQLQIYTRLPLDLEALNF